MQAPADSAAVPLAVLQAGMSAALLAADPAAQALPEEWFAGVRPGAAGLRVHRNTVLAALSNALRASYVSVDRLVGEDFFDRMAVAYARARPPLAPQLDAYGRDFPAFMDGFPGTESLPYLAALARFDWQIDELGRRLPAGQPPTRTMRLEGGAHLHFEATLAMHQAHYPVDELRRSALAEDAAALAVAGGQRGEFRYAMWRAAPGVQVRRLSAAAARFLTAALTGADAEEALGAAAAGSDAAEIAGILAREILPAGFTRIEPA